MHKNLFVVGAMKSGSTSLYEYLNQHPKICMSAIKEPNFFAKEIDPNMAGFMYKDFTYLDFDKYFSNKPLVPFHLAFVTKESDYKKLSEGVEKDTYFGDASTSYLYSEYAAEEIKKYDPNAKVVILLRNPIRRAYSHYVMMKRAGYEKNLSIIDAMKQDMSKKKKGWGISFLYYEVGLYADQVMRYMNQFDKKNIYIVRNEELRVDTAGVLYNICNFLGVDQGFEFETSSSFNVGGEPKFLWINQLLIRRKIRRRLKNLFPLSLIKKIHVLWTKIENNFLSKEKSFLTKEEFEYLADVYSVDITKLESIIGVDLSHWLEYKS